MRSTFDYIYCISSIFILLRGLLYIIFRINSMIIIETKIKKIILLTFLLSSLLGYMYLSYFKLLQTNKFLYFSIGILIVIPFYLGCIHPIVEQLGYSHKSRIELTKKNLLLWIEHKAINVIIILSMVNFLR